MEESNSISLFYKKYLHRLDSYEPDNDFYRKDNLKLGINITQNDIKKYKNDFQAYFINRFIEKFLNQIKEEIVNQEVIK